MKTIITILLSVITSLALAEVEITSFVYSGTQTRTAELCGKLSPQDAVPAVVKITVDGQTKNPGIYYTTAYGPNFCHLVHTTSGKADAVIFK